MLSMVTFISFIKDIACINDICKHSESISLIIVDYDYYLSTAIFRSTVAMLFSVSKLVRLVLIGACMIYFIHLHHVIVLGQRLGETLLWRFGAQFYSTPLQKVERGIVI